MVEEGNTLNLLKELFTLLFNKKRIIIITTIVFVLLGGIFTFLIRSKSFVATSSIMFGRVADYIPQEGESQLLSEIQFNSSIIGNYKNFLKSDEVLKIVMENLSLEDTLGDFKEDIDLFSTGSNIEIKVTYESEEMAEKIANEIVNVFVQKSKDFYQIEHTYTINYADESTTESDVNHLADLLVFAVLGLFISCCTIYVRFLMNPTIIIEDSIENKLKLSMLGTIKINNVNNIDGKEEFEQFNLLRTNVELCSDNDNNIKTILVIPSGDSTEKNYISGNLALSFAKVGKKVLLIDVDKTNGNLSDIFNIENKNGFYDYFSDNKNKKDNKINNTKFDNLDFIPRGNNSNITIQKEEVADYIKDMEKKYNIIIINGSEILNYSDSRILSNICDKTILVSTIMNTKEIALNESAKEVNKSQGDLLGVVLTK